MYYLFFKFIIRCQREEDNWTTEDNDLQQSNEPSVRRKISSEISSLAVAQHIDSWSSNLIELFTDGNRKSSSTNMNSGILLLFYDNYNICLNHIFYNNNRI